MRPMILDTGARLTILDIESARRIGLEMREARDMRLVGVAGSAPVSVGKVEEVSMLGQTVRDLQVICHPLNERMGFDGVLGMNFLQHFNFEVRSETEVFAASKWGE
jgi:predicted aspartyl protease